jgi:hypothetical protein
VILENLMLRQQLNIYKRKNKRPKLENIDSPKFTFVSAYRKRVNDGLKKTYGTKVEP